MSKWWLSLLLLSAATSAFLQPSPPSKTTTSLHYEPKWKKKETLASEGGPNGGTIPVLFLATNATTTAWPGQNLRDVASQAGQFVNYGCGKGECGTCECNINGQWMRPCVAKVPMDAVELRMDIPQTKRKSLSSGKFYSVRSFFMGFYNNLLGMVGFVKSRRAARKNWRERQEYEDLIKQKTLEKKQQKQKLTNVE